MSAFKVRSFINSETGKAELSKASTIKIGSNCKNVERKLSKDLPTYEHGQEKALICYTVLGTPYIFISDKNIYLKLWDNSLLTNGSDSFHQLPINDIIYFKMKKKRLQDAIDIYYKDSCLGNFGTPYAATSPLKFFELLFEFCRNFSNESKEDTSQNRGEEDNIEENENITETDQDSSKFDEMIRMYSIKGYTLAHSDKNMALMKHKQFSILLFILLILIGFIPGLIYLAFYMFVQKEEMVEIKKRDGGEISVSQRMPF